MRWALFLAAAAPIVLAAPALAQTDPPAMQMTWPTTTPPATTETDAADTVDHSAMDHGEMAMAPPPPAAQQSPEAAPMPSMQGMDHGAMGHGGAAMDTEVGNQPAPAPPTDHAADQFYDRNLMEASRAQLRREHGGTIVSRVMLNLGEVGFGEGDPVFRWEGEGWIGGDINRFVLKSEGEASDGDIETAEVQALYSRAVSPYFDVQAGIRYDLEPSPNRTYAVIGFEGVAPYWFETSGAVFVSNEGEVRARLEGSYDARLTQRLILQPRAEVNLAAEDIPDLGIGAGVTDVELGLRLRFEIRREFAPYIGVSYESQLGDTADFTEAAGGDASDTRFVIGIRAWF